MLQPPRASDQDPDRPITGDAARVQQHVRHQTHPHFEKMHVVAGKRHVRVVDAHLARERLAIERPAFAERLRLQLLGRGMPCTARVAIGTLEVMTRISLVHGRTRRFPAATQQRVRRVEHVAAGRLALRGLVVAGRADAFLHRRHRLDHQRHGSCGRMYSMTERACSIISGRLLWVSRGSPRMACLPSSRVVPA